ncbi:nuclease superfamily protein [Moumouvirus goulette]|uniref:Nuclease superfamily protein n=1 Tax=Moumouvirus goulette TaxID=1247379 RepID=M1PMK8_9VIRU|nr:nuclease superfamily protein [Moumouvirus goulette]AGF85201.1 nuclease superfamily protein [Moumouvirus goulette]
MSNWVCYLIMSLDSNDTYIGSTNNQPKRLNAHNNNNPDIVRKGAKRTRAQTWVPVIIISGFHDKRACLSFESGWKRLARRRNNNRLHELNSMSDENFKYTRDTKWNRIMDLLYFVHNITLLDTKFKLNHNIQHPINIPNYLTINIFIEKEIKLLPWPFYINCHNVKFDDNFI